MKARQGKRTSLGLAVMASIAVSAGCRQVMSDPPYYRPYAASAFFADGASARPLPAGTIAREWLRDDDVLASGLKAEFREQPSDKSGPAVNPSTPPVGAADDPGHFVTEVPFKLSRADLERGQDRFTIFCAVCHGPLGDGNGKVPERGFQKPPNYHTDLSRGFSKYGKSVLLREAPIGYFFEVITKGYGAMPRYGPQVEARDRWRIAAYVRALQLSQHATVDALPPSVQRAAQTALKEAP